MSENEVNHDELIAAAEAAVQPAKDAVKTADAAYKDAKKNHKAAVDYRKSLADDDEGIAEADESVNGWAAEEERTKGELDTAKESAKEATEAVKAAKAAKREAGKAAREAAKAAREAEKASRVRQNGVLSPKPGSKCGRAWEIFDAVSANEGRPAMLAEGVAMAEQINAEIEAGTREEEELHSIGNVRAEYSQWRKFHGIPAQGRPKKEKPEAPVEAEAEQPVEEAAE